MLKKIGHLDNELPYYYFSAQIRPPPKKNIVFFFRLNMKQNQLSAVRAAIDYFAEDAGNLSLTNGEISLLERQVG